MPETSNTDDVALLNKAAEQCKALKARLQKTVIGQEAVVEALLTAVLAEGHVLLVGVPGLAKTLLVKTLAESLGLSFSRIQFTPDLMPADIVGAEVLQPDEDGHLRKLDFVPGPVFANLLLADEINRTPPKTQAALLEAMQERQVTSLGKTRALPNPFVCVATQNPIEQDGTYPLPEAQLDRFLFSVWLNYPSKADETRVVLETVTQPSPDKAPSESVPEKLGGSSSGGPVLTIDELQAIQSLVRRVPVAEQVADYAVSLVRSTRPDCEEAGNKVKDYVQWGAGTRAAQAMVLGGKALAVMHGEPAVTVEHVQSVAPFVLRHRILTNYQAAADGVDVKQLVESLIDGL